MNGLPSPFHRRTIIVDACLLKALTCPVTHEVKNEYVPGINNFLEILPWLGDQGVCILIPEMVAYESAAQLSNGVCISDYFPRNDSERRFVIPKELRTFLKNVADKKYRNIELVPSTEPEEVREFLERLHTITQQHTKPCPKATAALCAAQKTNTSQYGDYAIEALIDQMPEEVISGKLCLLSSDKTLLRRASMQAPKVALLNLEGLVHGLVDSGAIKALGLKKDTTSRQILDLVYKNLNRIHQQSEGHRPSSSIDCAETTDWSIQDQKPFVSAMRQLASELHTHQEEPGDHEKNPLGAVSRAKRFTEKFGAGPQAYSFSRPGNNGRQA